MESTGKLSARKLAKLTWASKTGKAGIIMLGIMIGLSVVALVTLPLNYGTAEWSNIQHWSDFPKLVPPSWSTLFNPAIVPQTFMQLDAPSTTNTANVGGTTVNYLTYKFTYTYSYQTFPQDVRIALYGLTAQNSNIPVILTVSVIRPDGEINPLYYEPIPIPPSQKGVLLFYPDAKAVGAYGNSAMAPQLGSFFLSQYQVSIAPSVLGGYSYGSERALFAKPILSGSVLQLQPLAGTYTFLVNVQFTSTQDTLRKVTLAVLGGAYGIMGTDFEGRDIAQGLLFGFPIALLIGVVTSLLATTIGTLLGLLSGFYGRIIEEVVQRTADLLGHIPLLPLLILLTFVTPTSFRIPTLITILIVFGWTGLAIIIRSIVISIKSEPYVEAAVAVGASNRRIIFKHILPQVLPFSIAQMIFFTPGAILTEAALSVLGLGDPNIPTWGQILSRVLDTGAAAVAWWWLLPPGLLIVFAAVTFVLIALALEPVVDPRFRRR